jgi:soluble lytic murein transglycosylase
LNSTLRRSLVLGAAVVIAGGFATAQTLQPAAPATATAPAPAVSVVQPPAPPPLVQTPQIAYRRPLSESDAQGVLAALAGAKSGDGGRIRTAMTGLSDPLARRIALWALADTAPDSMSFMEADTARRDLAGWPRAAKRQAAAEKVLETGGLRPQSVIAWFGGAEPATAQGAMALASAYWGSGEQDRAIELLRRTWRTQLFEADVQRTFLARYGQLLTQADHVAREDMLLYGPQGDAARDMLVLLPPDQQALAQARMAVRRGDSDAQSRLDALPVGALNAPGLAYERFRAFVARGQVSSALALNPYMPKAIPVDGAAARMWDLRSGLVVAALKNGDSRGAYDAAANSGLTSGADAAEAEFYAGWLALTRLKNAKLADDHFARVQAIGRSPITQGRALYWRGRALEAQGDTVGAQLYYGQGARYYTTFYGQLAAVKAGQRMLILEKDPEITAADRARFEGRESVRAARTLAEIGAKDTFKVFVAGIAETLPSAAEEALLVDMVRGYGDLEAGMRTVRTAAQRGFILPERGYPLRAAPPAPNAPEPAFVLGITRQESSFDPRARSGAGARGMMQLMPGTAQVQARKMGVGYSYDQLEDPEWNMRVGSAYLGDLVGSFGGSYVMASAGYNAGPGRPASWTSFCGDPRGATDPLDYIECIPFSETRNYVMRVMEATQVYRARLAGGSAPITLANDLKRGTTAYGAYGSAITPVIPTAATAPAPIAPTTTSTP